MSRAARAGWALGAVALWYGLCAEPLARQLEEQRAGQLRTAGAPEAVELLLAMAEQDPDALPRGADRAAALALLEEVLALEQAQMRWSEGATALLSPAQLAVVAANTGRPPLPRSRGWPRTPSELLAIVRTLAERHGSAFGDPPPPPAQDLLPGVPPLERVRGLAALVELNEPPLSDAQAHALQLAALEGIRAHELGWERSQALIDALGPAARRVRRPPGAARGDEGRTALALGLLRP